MAAPRAQVAGRGGSGGMVRGGGGSGGIVRFAQESWAELQKVTWPSRETIVRLTILVLIISTLIGLYILGADQVFTFVINRLLLGQDPEAAPPPAP